MKFGMQLSRPYWEAVILLFALYLQFHCLKAFTAFLLPNTESSIALQGLSPLGKFRSLKLYPKKPQMKGFCCSLIFERMA